MIAIGPVALALLAYWLVRRKQAGKPKICRPPVLEELGLAEVEHNPRNNRARAL